LKNSREKVLCERRKEGEGGEESEERKNSNGSFLQGESLSGIIEVHQTSSSWILSAFSSCVFEDLPDK